MIGRITTQMTTRAVLGDIMSASERLSHYQEQLSSGKQLTKPSDDPTAVGSALRLHADLDANRQYQRNVDAATAWQDATDSALGSIGDIVGRVRELVVQAGNDAIGPSARAEISSEIAQLIDDVKGAANSQYSGRFIFSGSKTDTPPYAVGASDAYAGNTDVVTREIGPGVQLDLNTVGSAVVGDGSSGLLKTLRDVVSHLQTNDGTSLRGVDLSALDAATDAVSNARAAVGARTNRLESADSRLKDLEQVASSQLSNIEDADMAEAVVHYSTQQAVYQAALRAGSQIFQPSLMDFLK